jgi:nitrite reductase (NADH) small subunit
VTDAQRQTQGGPTPDGQGWSSLCALADVPSEGGHYVVHDGRALAVFRDDTDIVRVIDDCCPHAGGSLSGGVVVDGCVHCPWHDWPFDLATGRCPDNPQIKVVTYPTRVADGQVWVEVGG